MSDEVQEWLEKHKDDPDVQAAVDDLRLPRTETGETAVSQRQPPERLGDGSYVISREIDLLQFLVKREEPQTRSPRERVSALLWRARFEYVLERMTPRYARIIRNYFYRDQSQERATGGQGGAWATRAYRAALGQFMRTLVEHEQELRAISIKDAAEEENGRAA